MIEPQLAYAHEQGVLASTYAAIAPDVNFWNARNGYTLMHTLSGATALSIAFSPDGHLFAMFSRVRSLLKVYQPVYSSDARLISLTLLHEQDGFDVDNPESLKFSPNGKILAFENESPETCSGWKIPVITLLDVENDFKVIRSIGTASYDCNDASDAWHQGYRSYGYNWFDFDSNSKSVAGGFKSNDWYPQINRFNIDGSPNPLEGKWRTQRVKEGVKVPISIGYSSNGRYTNAGVHSFDGKHLIVGTDKNQIYFFDAGSDDYEGYLSPFSGDTGDDCKTSAMMMTHDGALLVTKHTCTDQWNDGGMVTVNFFDANNSYRHFKRASIPGVHKRTMDSSTSYRGSSIILAAGHTFAILDDKTIQIWNAGTCGKNQFWTTTVCKPCPVNSEQIAVSHSEASCTCDKGYVGSKCQYTDAQTCNGKGVVQHDGKCTCDGPETGLGPTCSEYTNAKTCNGVGVVDSFGKCTCDGPEIGVGPTCSEHTNAKTCNDAGVVDSTGKCTCNDPAVGEGPSCSEYTNAKTCNDAGVVDSAGKCSCSGPGTETTGFGPTCIEMTNTKTCSGAGVVDAAGQCTCTDPAVGVGPACEFSNAKTCSDAGVVDAAGQCTCTDPAVGVGPACEFSNAKTCSDAGVAQADGTCTCTDPAVGAGRCDCSGDTTCPFSNAKTCSDAGVVNAAGQCTCTQQQALRDANMYNGCVCLGPETGVGRKCEFSNAKTCTDYGVAQPDGNCLCSTGYTGTACGECTTATHTWWDTPSAGGGFECLANFGESCDRGFYFNTDTTDATSRACTICPSNTYADGILDDGQYDDGKRIACQPCPDEFQVSPAGSVSVDQCQYKWKLLDPSSETWQATMAAGFCTGLDAESTLHFTTMANGADDCQEYASTKQLNFSSGLPACEDLAASDECDEVVCEAARAGKSIEVTTSAGGKESAAEVCKVTCGLCDSGTNPELATPSGCVLERESDSSDPTTGIVRYYADEERKRYLGVYYTPICESFVCPVALQEVVAESTMDSPPVCAYGSTFTDVKEEEEGNIYVLFYYITFGSISFIVCLAYSGSKHCCCRAKGDWEWPKWPTHRFIWVGLVFRLADLATDWAFVMINVHGELFKAKVDPTLLSRTGSGGMFDPTTSNFDLETYKLAALIVCIVSSVLTPIDILSKMPTCQTRREDAGMKVLCYTLGRKVAIVVALLVILVEDIPQIWITGVFIVQKNGKFLDFSDDWISAALTVANMVMSCGSLLYNLYAVIRGCCTWKNDAEETRALERRLEKQKVQVIRNKAFDIDI